MFAFVVVFRIHLRPSKKNPLEIILGVIDPLSQPMRMCLGFVSFSVCGFFFVEGFEDFIWLIYFFFTVKEFNRFFRLKSPLDLKFTCNSHTKFFWNRNLCLSHLPSMVYFHMTCIEFISL